MKIKRLLALVLTIATFATLCTVGLAADKVVVANYYDTSDFSTSTGSAGYGFNGKVSVKPVVERAPLDLDVKANWAKVGAVAANNLEFLVPAQKDAEGKNILDDNGVAIQDTANTTGMTYIAAKIVKGAKEDKATGKDYPAGETPFITYAISADKGNYLTGLNVTSWGCVMRGGSSLEFYVTPEIPGKVTDADLKDLDVYDYLLHFGTAFNVDGSAATQGGNYTDDNAWKFNVGEEKLNPCGLAEQKSTTLYLTVVPSVPDTTTGAGMTGGSNGGTDGGAQIRFMGAKIEGTQAEITAYDPSDVVTPEVPDAGDALVISAAALAVACGAAVVFATRKKNED